MGALRLISCIGVDSELALLPHFVEHYRKLGVVPEDMILILNSEDPASPGLASAKRCLARRGVTRIREWIAPYTSDTMWARRREVQLELARADDWIISADVDEFHVYPAPLTEVLTHCEAIGATVIQGVFVDRLTRDGRLAEVEEERPLAEQFPVSADVIGTLGGSGRHHDRFGTVKLMAMRGAILPSRGGHHPLGGQDGVRFLHGWPLGSLAVLSRPERRFDWPFRVHHYKWTARLVPGLQRRLASVGVSPAGKEYGDKVLEHVRKHGGIALDEVTIDRIGYAERQSRRVRHWRSRTAWWRWRAALAHRWKRFRRVALAS